MNTEQKKLSPNAIKALAVIGVVVIILLGLWGVIQAVRLMPNVLSSLASAAASISSIFVPAEHIDISVADHTVNSGTPFTLSFTRTGGAKKGSYSFLYDCRDGVSFQAPDASGSYKDTFCNTPFNFSGAQSEVRLVPLSTKNRFIDVPVRVRFTPEGKSVPSSESVVTLTISNSAVTSSPSTTGTTGSTGSTGTTGSTGSTNTPRKPGNPSSSTYVITGGGIVSDPNGRIDLATRILEVGTIDPVTNVFTRTNVIHARERAAVRFVVENLGTKTAPYFNFNAVLPTYPYFIYSSDTQPALNPGDRIEYTIGFDSADPRINNSEFVINVDPSGGMNEVTKANNIARITLSIIP